MTESRPVHGRRRIVLISIGATLLALVIGCSYVLYDVSRFMKAEVEQSTQADEDFRAYLAQHIDLSIEDAEIAWQQLVSLAERIELVTGRTRAMLAERGFPPRSTFDDTGQPDWEYVTSFAQLPDDINRERLAIKQLREKGVFDRAEEFASLAPAIRPPTIDWIADLDALAFTGALRTFSRARTASLRMSAEASDWHDVAAGFDAVLAVNHTLLLQSDLMLPLVGMASLTRAMAEVRHILREYRVPSDARQRMLDSLDRFSVPPATVLLESGRADWRRGIDAMYTSHLADGDGYLRQMPMPSFVDFEADYSWMDAIHARFLLPTRHEMLELSEVFFRRSRSLANLSQAELIHEQREILTWIELLRDRYELFQISAPTVLRALQARGYPQLDELALRIMLALEAFRDDHDVYPASLDELVPDYLATISSDPMTGKPFGYRSVSDDPIGRQYLLYSWGSNLTDNGGSESEDEGLTMRIRSFDSPPPGYDYVLNHPRSELDYGIMEDKGN